MLKENPRLKILKVFVKKDRNDPSYLSFVNYSYAGYEGDVFGNILACILGLADDKKIKRVTSYLIREKANQPWPIKAVLNPIKTNDKLWREYMGRHDRINRSKRYHNGGIWPFIGGFWVILLSMVDEKLAKRELIGLAQLNNMDNWAFREWFDGQTDRKSVV